MRHSKHILYTYTASRVNARLVWRISDRPYCRETPQIEFSMRFCIGLALDRICIWTSPAAFSFRLPHHSFCIQCVVRANRSHQPRSYRGLVRELLGHYHECTASYDPGVQALRRRRVVTNKMEDPKDKKKERDRITRLPAYSHGDPQMHGRPPHWNIQGVYSTYLSLRGDQSLAFDF
jgi:hypothetical protein